MKHFLFSLLSLFLFSSISCMNDDQSDDQKIEIINLPSERWEEFKQLRVMATRHNPIEIGVTEADELKRDEKMYKELLEKASNEKNNDTWMVFAQEKGELIGMAGAQCEKPHLSTMRHVAKIFSVWVTPQRRNTGIGTSLMHAVLRRLILSNNIMQVQLHVNAESDAIGFYERLGFEECGTLSNTIMINGNFHASVVMEKDIIGN